MSNNDRFIEVQDKNGTHHIGTSVEYITMPDGTFLSDNLGNLNVMQKGSVEARLDGLENNQYAPITNPQFLEGLSVITQNNNTAFKVAEVNDEWQTKVKGQLLINGNYNKGITITPPISSTTKSILVADNGIQVKVDSDSILNINSNNLEVLKDIALNNSNLTTTGEITANNLAYGGKVSNRDQLDTFMNKYKSTQKLYLIRLGYKVAYTLATGNQWETGKTTRQGFGFCTIEDSGKKMTVIFRYGNAIYDTQISRGENLAGETIDAYRSALKIYKLVQTKSLQTVATILKE